MQKTPMELHKLSYVLLVGMSLSFYLSGGRTGLISFVNSTTRIVQSIVNLDLPTPSLSAILTSTLSV